MPLIQIVDVSEPGELNLRAQRGALFSLDLTYGTGSENFSNSVFRMQAWVEKTKIKILDITNTTSQSTVGIVYGGTNRSIHVIVPTSVTEDWPERLCNFQLEMKQGNDWVPVITGKLIVKPNPIPAS